MSLNVHDLLTKQRTAISPALRRDNFHHGTLVLWVCRFRGSITVTVAVATPLSGNNVNLLQG